MHPTDVLQGRPPIDAAVELVRRYAGQPSFGEAATRWIELARSHPSVRRWKPEQGSGRHDPVEAVATILRSGAISDAHAADVVTRLMANVGVPEPALVGAALAVLSAPEPTTPRDALVAWAARAEGCERLAVARAFDDEPDFAHSLLGPSTPLPLEVCAKCGTAHLAPCDGLNLHLLLLLFRPCGQRPLLPVEDALIRSVPPISWFDEEWLFTHARALRRSGVIVPALDELAESQLGEECLWARAATWLAGTRRHTELVVANLIEVIGNAEAPEAPLRRLSASDGDRALHGGVFTGPGWKRDRRFKILRPVALALLDRGSWPAAALHPLFEPGLGAPRADEAADHHEAGWIGVQELLAEGLVATALDDRRAVELRERALMALGELRPGGKGTWLRAIRKIDRGPLAEVARQVQRACARQGAAVDAELAVQDAVRAFFDDAAG